MQHAKRLSFICGLDHLSILKNVGEDLNTKYVISVNPISICISVTKAIAGLQIRALLQLLGCLLMIDLTVCIFKLLEGQLSVFGLRNHCHRNRHEILHKNVSLTFVLVKS